MPQHAAAPAAPSSPAPGSTGTEASRRLLHPESSAPALTLWGSSSMSSEGGAEATAVPVRIHEHLALAAAPAAVHPFGVGATRSPHTLLQRGLVSPALRPEGGPEPGTGRRAVTLDSELRPAGPLRIPGRVDGVEGILDGSSGDWFFVPTDPADEITGGTFTSSLAEIAEGSRQVLWMGKNNIRDVEAVLEHTARMARRLATRTPSCSASRCTENDPIGSETGAAVAEVNAATPESTAITSWTCSGC